MYIEIFLLLDRFKYCMNEICYFRTKKTKNFETPKNELDKLSRDESWSKYNLSIYSGGTLLIETATSGKPLTLVVKQIFENAVFSSK